MRTRLFGRVASLALLVAAPLTVTACDGILDPPVGVPLPPSDSAGTRGIIGGGGGIDNCPEILLGVRPPRCYQ